MFKLGDKKIECRNKNGKWRKKEKKRRQETNEDTLHDVYEKLNYMIVDKNVDRRARESIRSK